MGRIIWIEGTSIEDGYGVSLPFHQRAVYPGGYSLKKKAVASRTIALCANNTDPSNNITDRIGDAGGLVLTLGPTGGANACIVIGSGNTNDAYFGVDGATAWAHVVALAALIKAACPLADLVLIEPLPRNNWSSSPAWGGSAAPFNQALADFVALARANWKAAGFSRPPVNLNPTGRFNNTAGPLFQDACHPSTEGHALLAAEWELSMAWAA